MDGLIGLGDSRLALSLRNAMQIMGFDWAQNFGWDELRAHNFQSIL